MIIITHPNGAAKVNPKGKHMTRMHGKMYWKY
jgi:hypothetical protein